MDTCERCGSGLVYRFNVAATPESAYVYVCLGDAHHAYPDPATLRSDARPAAAVAERRSRLLERRPLRAGGFATA